MNAIELLNSKFRENYAGPVLVVNKKRVIENVQRFRAAMPNVDIHYAVKANPNVRILSTLIDQGISFDVASLNEIELLGESNLLASKDLEFGNILYSNPVRSSTITKAACAQNVVTFVIDSKEEVDRLAELSKSDDRICGYIRLVVSNDQSAFPLTGKFGVKPEHVETLIDYCNEKGVDLIGVSFHVGSQCSNVDNWVKGIRQAKIAFAYMIAVGMFPTMLNIGGGYPVQHTQSISTIEEIGAAIETEIADLIEIGYQVVAEPGRFIVSDAGHMLTQVISTKVAEDDQKWVFLDTGMFHGLIEASVGDFKYNYWTDKSVDFERDHHPSFFTKCVLAGPTCDSLDVVTRNQYFPHNLQSEDFVVVMNCGAYTTTYGTEFNGFPSPITVVV